MLTRRYPILRLIIPMFIGMIGAFSVYEITGYQPVILLVVLVVAVLCTVYSYIKNHTRVFIITSTITFLTFGYELTSRSLDNAYHEYGKNWKYELYNHNPFASAKALDIQKKLHKKYSEHGLTGETGSIIEAMTIGWRQGLTKDTKDCFSKAGLSHTLALSGFHITIVFLLLHYIFLGRIVSHRWKIQSNVLSILCLWAYAFMAGMQPSLVRATIMCSLLVFTQSFGRRVTPLNSCLLTGMIMLIIEPLILFHLGFQLSFSAVIGICTLGDTLCRRFKINAPKHAPFIKTYTYKTLNAVKDIAIISLVCNIFTIPIVAYTFHQIPLLSIVSNLMATMLVSALIILSAIWWATIWSASLSTFILAILQWTASAICTIAHTIASIPYSVYFCTPTLTECILMYGIILTMTLAIRKHTSHRLIALLIAIITYCLAVIIRKTVL
ncbi:MAG: ComEC/Rec2 family competence protein [Bacteroidaceae bacterium]|nr:ComEC/Rec2 family competence protein [Bacteroidaceae bacterium]